MSNRTLSGCFWSVLAMSLTLLSGCAQIMKNSADFNEMLSDGATTAPKRSCLSVKEGEEACVLPGMKLEVVQIDARLNTQQDRSLVESRTEWTIPSVDNFSQEDLFHFAWLLSVSDSKEMADPSRCYEAWLNQTPYPDVVRSVFMRMVLDTLKVGIENPTDQGEETAADVQKWMRRIPKLHNAKGQNYFRQNLIYAIPLLDPAHSPPGTPQDCIDDGRHSVQLKAFESGSPFQREPTVDPGEPVTNLSGPRGWYRDGKIVEARAYVAILVPITVAGQAGTFYEPVDSSLTDVATDLGQPVENLIAIRRNKNLIPIEKIPTSQNPDLSQDAVVMRGITPDDCLHQKNDVCFSLSTDILVDKGIFKDLLIAPRDEVIFRNMR
jgi:hypothetical protein